MCEECVCGKVPVCVRGQGARNIRGGEVLVLRGQGAYNIKGRGTSVCEGARCP